MNNMVVRKITSKYPFQCPQESFPMAEQRIYLDKPTTIPHPEQNNFAEYLDHLSDGFVILDPRKIIIYANSSFFQHLDINGPVSSTGIELLSIQGINTCTPLVNSLKSIDKGKQVLIDFPLTNNRGELKFLELSATPIQTSDNTYRAILILRDKTSQKQTLAHLEALSVIAEASNQSRNLDEIILTTLVATQHALSADGAILYLLEPNEQSFKYIHAVGITDLIRKHLTQHPLPMSTGLIGAVLAKGVPRAVADIRRDKTAFPELSSIDQIISIAVAPMLSTNEIIGILVVFNRVRRHYGSPDLTVLASIASQIEIAIRNDRLLKELIHQARTDSLTGLLNRGYFMELANRELNRTHRTGSDLALLMIDVDHFKLVNDQYGHIIGDEILCDIANHLRSSTRNIDLVGRYGGDEFIILLTDCNQLQARQVIKRIERWVTSLQIPCDKDSTQRKIRLSIGLATLDHQHKESLEEFIIRADTEMYRAKGHH
jgi:diguanylate cyclase (GGDEF)-like protein